MADHLSTELTAAASAMPDSALYGAKLRRIRASFTLAAQADGDILVLGTLPIGASLVAIMVTSSVSLGGTATIALGIAGAAGKYRAAATHTPTVPTLYGLAAAKDDAPLAAEEQVIATIAAAALPASGQLVFDLIYTTRA